MEKPNNTDRDIKPMTKGQVMEKMGIKHSRTFRNFCKQTGVRWEPGYMYYTAAEVAFIFKEYDYSPVNN